MLHNSPPISRCFDNGKMGKETFWMILARERVVSDEHTLECSAKIHRFPRSSPTVSLCILFFLLSSSYLHIIHWAHILCIKSAKVKKRQKKRNRFFSPAFFFGMNRDKRVIYSTLRTRKETKEYHCLVVIRVCYACVHVRLAGLKYGFFFLLGI